VCHGRYPLARVSRILASRHIDWRGDALAACLARGIGIVFLDARGDWYGSCAPALTRVSPITELLEELVEDTQWPRTFDNFMRHLGSKVLLEWLAERTSCAADAAEVAAWRRCYVYQARVPVTLGYDYRGLLRAMVESHLHGQLIRVRYQRGDAQTEAPERTGAIGLEDLVEDEDGKHGARPGRGRKGRVVGQAQVLPDPPDHRFRHVIPRMPDQLGGLAARSNARVRARGPAPRSAARPPPRRCNA